MAYRPTPGHARRPRNESGRSPLVAKVNALMIRVDAILLDERGHFA
jgi:hypothetical protein